MKKKVLFALIALFSFLTTWAQQVVPAGGDYAATLGQGVGYNVNRPYVLTGEGLPLVTGITFLGDPVTGTVIPALGTGESASPANYKVYKKETGGMVAVNKHNGSGDDALEVGNYWLQFQIETSQKLATIYVPFQVYMVGTYDYIDSEVSFNGSVNKSTGYLGGLQLYYADEDYQDAAALNQDKVEGVPTWTKAAGWGEPKHNSGSGYPIIVPVAPEDNKSYKCLFLYKGVYSQPWETSARSIFSYNQVNDANSGLQISRQYGLISVNDEVDPGTGVIVINPGNDFGPEGLGLYSAPEAIHGNPSNPEQITGWNYENTYKGTVDQNQFDKANFKMYWMPADDMGDLVNPTSVDRATIENGSATIPAYTYNSVEQKPNFGASGNATFKATSNGDALVEGTDFTVAWPDADYTNVGTKNITITGIGKYKGTRTVTYDIDAYTLTASNFSLSVTGEQPEGPQIEYTGADVKPGVAGNVSFTIPGEDSPLPVTLDGAADYDAKLFKKVTGGEDVELTGENKKAVNVGEYYYSITGKGNFTTTGNAALVFNFAVTPKDLRSFLVTLPTITIGEGVNAQEVPGFIYNTDVQKPIFKAVPAEDITANAFVRAAQGTEPLKEGTDFTVRYPYDEDNDDATDYKKVGNKPYIIVGIGNYTGSIGNDEEPRSYRIAPKNINDIPVKAADVIAPTFTGEAFNLTQDNFKFKFNNIPLQLGTDFSWELDYTGVAEEERETYRTAAGNKNIIVTGIGNYEGTWNTTVEMKQFAITITAIQTTKVYGQPDPAPEFSIDTNSQTQIAIGSDEYKYIQSFLVMERDLDVESNYPEVKENVIEGGHKYVIKKKANIDECNYEIYIQERGANLMITPAPLTVHVANNSKTYGDPDPVFTADKKNGNTVVDAFQIINPNAATAEEADVTNAKDFVDNTKDLKEVLNIGRKPGEDVKTSPYDFTWDNPNYAVTFDPASFTINQKHLNSIAVTFDDQDYKGVALKPIPTVTANNGSIELQPGVDFIVEHFDGSANGNTTRDVTLGNRNTWPKATVKQPTEFVGNYDFTASNNNYWKIVPATLKIAAIADNSKVFGEPDPTPLAKVTFAQGYGPLGDDYYDYNTNGTLHSNFDILPSLLVRTGDDHVGTYVISVNPNATTRNYIIEGDGVTAKFHIYRSESTFTIGFTQPAVYTYGETPDLTALVTVEAPQGYTGNLTADLLAYAKENVKKYQTVEGVKTYIETNDAGEYKLTIDQAPTTFANYDVIVDEGILTINPFPLYIISNGTKEYGAEEPAYTWDVYEKKTVNNVETYVLTDKEYGEIYEEDYIGNSTNFFDNNYRYTISRESGENVGKYPTTIREYRNRRSGGRRYYGTRVVGNYSFTFAPGTFEITLRKLEVSVTGNSKIYGKLDPVKELVRLEPRTDEEREDNIEMFTKGLVKIQVTNALPRDVQAIADKVNYSNRTAGEVVTAIGYAINGVQFAGATQPNELNPNDEILRNYKLSYSKNTQFMIEKRVLKVTAHDQSVPYANPLVVDPYDLTIVESILIDGNANEVPVDVNYDDIVTFMGPENNPKINDKVEDVFKPLTVAEGKTAVGKFHRDAFVLELTDAAKQNYEIELTNGKLYIEQLNDLYLDMANLAQTLNDHKGRVVTVHMIGAPDKEEGCNPFRQWMRNVWNSFVLPFDAYPRDIVKPFQYGVIDILNIDNDVENNFSLAVTTKKVPANTPFIIQNDKNMRTADMANVKWENVTISDNLDYLNEDPTATDAAGNKFIGTYKPKSDFTDVDYIIPENENEFFRFLAAAGEDDPVYDMKQTEAYLEAFNPAGAPVRIVIDNEDGTATAIEFVGAEAVTTTSAAEGWYTVNGVKLEGEPTTSGTYIFNGKKVFIQK